MSSVRAIAKQVGVSRMTVSRALNHDPRVRHETRRRVMEAVRNASYTPATGRRVTTTIGYANLSGGPSIQSPWRSQLSSYLGALMHGIWEEATAHGFDIAILNPHRDKLAEETYGQYFLRRGARAVVVRAAPEQFEDCRLIAQEGFPMMLINTQLEDEKISYVCHDAYVGSLKAMEHLIGLGHRRIAFVGRHQAVSKDVKDRSRAYEAAMRDAALPIDPRWVFADDRTQPPNGRYFLNKLMALRPAPTAIYLDHDETAASFLIAAHESGLSIPGDLSVVGFDNANVRQTTWPKMSAVCQDSRRMGKEAVFHLAQCLAADVTGHIKPMRNIIPTFFEANDTTAAPHEYMSNSQYKKSLVTS